MKAKKALGLLALVGFGTWAYKRRQKKLSMDRQLDALAAEAAQTNENQAYVDAGKLFDPSSNGTGW